MHELSQRGKETGKSADKRTGRDEIEESGKRLKHE